MIWKHVFKGRLAGALLLTVPVVAVLALGPANSVSQASNTAGLQFADNGAASLSTVLTGQQIESLSDWKYTGKSAKSAKSMKSKKSNASMKSQKSKKLKKSKKP